MLADIGCGMSRLSCDDDERDELRELLLGVLFPLRELRSRCVDAM
jgi:hypothetical protein